MIRRLGYISRPADKLSHAEIPRIVSVSRNRNAIDDITGILLFTGLDFVQLVEGTPLAVANLWTRISTDVRHRDVMVVLDERDDTRWFTDWRVGFSSDSVLAGQVEAWRQVQVGKWNDVGHTELRRVLAAADTL
jgi:Sensors of blue-light using FAD